MALNQQNRAEAVSLMRRTVDFERSGISGRMSQQDSQPRKGDLPHDVYKKLIADIREHGNVYIVFSYTTPIAWVNPGGLVILPEIRYSTTTSRHQKMVREAYGDERINVRGISSAPKPNTSQYAELTEDELIELATQKAESGSTSELAAVLGALKIRREVSAPSRARIAEYLRQQAIVQAEHDADVIAQEKNKAEGRKFYGTPKKAPEDVLDEVRADEYAKTARLRLADLQRLVTPVVRDTKAEFYAEQEDRLQQWVGSKRVTEKQAALLPCIAAGHISSHRSSGGYSGDHTGTWNDGTRCQTCQRPDGRIMRALLDKNVITTRPSLGWNHPSAMMLKKPE